MKYIVKYSTSTKNSIVAAYSIQEDTYTLGTNELEVSKKVYCIIYFSTKKAPTCGADRYTK